MRKLKHKLIETYDHTPFRELSKKYEGKINIHIMDALQADMHYMYGLSSERLARHDMVIALQEYSTANENSKLIAIKNRFSNQNEFNGLKDLDKFLEKQYGTD